MGSFITIFVVLLVILNNSEVVYSHEQQAHNSRSNSTQKDTNRHHPNRLSDREFNSLSENDKPADEGNDRPSRQAQKTSETLLDFSDTGRPGQQTAGESRGSCINADNNLEAIIPASHSGKTISGHPRFWVYFPYASHQVSHVEFIVQNEAREDIWRSQLNVEDDTGYKSFSIPETEAPLKVGQWYRWYVKIYCDRLASAKYVQGWVTRVPLLSKLYLELQQQPQLSHQIYGNHGIWYDAIDRLITVYQSEPHNMALERDWQNLIRAKGVELQQLPPIETTYEAVK